jgi:hypothetical protein
VAEAMLENEDDSYAILIDNYNKYKTIQRFSKWTTGVFGFFLILSWGFNFSAYFQYGFLCIVIISAFGYAAIDAAYGDYSYYRHIINNKENNDDLVNSITTEGEKFILILHDYRTLAYERFIINHVYTHLLIRHKILLGTAIERSYPKFELIRDIIFDISKLFPVILFGNIVSSFKGKNDLDYDNESHIETNNVIEICAVGNKRWFDDFKKIADKSSFCVFVFEEIGDGMKLELQYCRDKDIAHGLVIFSLPGGFYANNNISSASFTFKVIDNIKENKEIIKNDIIKLISTHIQK